MAFDTKGLDEYVDVAQRIADFRERYPDGGLREVRPWELVTVQNPWCRKCAGSRTVKQSGTWRTCPRCQGTGLRGEGEPPYDMFISYTAAAYRTPDDPVPGIGCAWEIYPGQTSYTAGSELQNAETSAWGRAIIAVGASDAKRGVASREEVRNRQAERDDDHAQANGHRRPARDHSGETPWDAEVRHEERPGSADPADLRAIHAAYYGKLGFDERTDALKILHTSEQLVGRALSGPHKGKSHKNLTWHEGKKLRAELEGFGADRGALLARLSGVTQAAAATAAQDASEGSQETLP